ncbi:hypothetical protein GCM10011335_18480 [Aureimonas glaciei]|uniref:Uncharacterized protein n=1 Tax=Aureimonas glaciei TaxID=1776957 RepID=A0A916XWA4_9HYPH|nr:hypothetical protein GCM10011335_18480 [Aureimonas glaciei]
MATTMPTLAKPIRALFGLTLAEAGFHNGQDQRLMGLLADEEMPVSALAHALDVRPSETGIRTQVSEAPGARLMWLRELRHRGPRCRRIMATRVSGWNWKQHRRRSHRFRAGITLRD